MVEHIVLYSQLTSRLTIIQRHHQHHRKLEPQIPREPCRSQSGIQDDSRAWRDQLNAARQMASGSLSFDGEGKRAESLEKTQESAAYAFPLSQLRALVTPDCVA